MAHKSQGATHEQHLEIAPRPLGKTICWATVLTLWLAFCAELLWEVWDLEAWRRVPFCTLAASGAYGVWRAGLCGHIRTDGVSLTLRNRFSRWHIPFSDIAEMSWTPGQGPLLRLHSGPTVRIDAYAGWPAGQSGRRLLAEVTARCGSGPGSTPQTSRRSRAGGVAELLVLAVWAWCFIVLR
ncbi:hypothetical protein [Streptomyces sp. NPDC057623]|uniref:hypothetical protein n=1 Tax=Streptomyces sp. NPDC057623 TaxID=3346187 RepID=UPI00369D49A7